MSDSRVLWGQPGLPSGILVAPSPPAWWLCSCLQESRPAGSALGTGKSCTGSAINTQG